jgi:hypothetical protein
MVIVDIYVDADRDQVRGDGAAQARTMSDSLSGRAIVISGGYGAGIVG